MYHRRKILLALIEAFGGTLTKTDCQKLTFLFCTRRAKNYYDFFPHKYGSFSLILAQDKIRLTDLGLLTSDNDFQINEDHSFLNQLDIKDRSFLHDLMAEIGNMRGEKLIRKTYLEAPHYVSRSLIARQILKDTEYEQISNTWEKEVAPGLFTIGYEGLSVDAYLDLLISNNIKVLVDVRKNPISMKYGFSKTKLTEYTKLAGIIYIHIPDLGIPSDLRQDLKSAESYQKLFDLYATQILPNHLEAIGNLKRIVSTNERVAITCFEANHHFCHRHKVTEYLENDPNFHFPIAHLHKERSNTIEKQNTSRQHGLRSENTLYSSI
jgi:uncharacterized protein (DUF488 family)